MTILCNILLILAVLLTFLLFHLKSDLVRLAGPDRTGADIVLYLIMGVRWLLVAFALAWCAFHSRFDWIGGSGARFFAVMGVHTGIGFLSALAMAATVSQVAGLRIGNPGMIGWAGIPLLFIIVSFMAVNGGPESALSRPGVWRWLQFALALLAAGGWLSAGGLWHTTSIESSRSRAEHAAARQAESDARAAEWNAKQAAEYAALESMDRALPLDQWIVQTHIQFSDKHQERAAELIAQRPRLVEELSEMLSSEDPMKREYANSFIRRLRPPPPGLIPALASAQRKLAAQLRAGAEGTAEMPSHPSGMSRSSLMTAGAMGDPSELREGLAEILAALEQLPTGEALSETMAMYRRFLAAEVGHGRTE